VLKYCFASAGNRNILELKSLYLFRIQNAIKSIDSATSAIKNFALKKVPKGGAVFVHGAGRLLFEVLQSAIKTKAFDILTVSSNVLLISELNKAKIKFQCFPDSAVKTAVQNADIVLMGCRAITSDKIIQAAGGQLVAEIAQGSNIPVYICSPAMSFTPAFSISSYKTSKRGNAIYHLFEQEEVSPSIITGVISEIGIYEHSSFIASLEREMPWLFT
jgi:translation initiation factor 2B subunit (eIF-2B alpha/beta/delta family)